jgi:hypothetical protein
MDFDFNINNYSIQTIEDFLNISKTELYTENELNDKINIIRNKILNSNDISNDFKNNFNEFLNLSKVMILKVKNNLNNIITPELKEYISTNHPIQPPQDISVKNIYNYKYPIGTINPVERRIVTKALCIDTLFRDNYNTTISSNFIYILPSPINNVINMKITSIEFPNFWYDFSSKKNNNSFTIELFNMACHPDKSFLITIPDGNYDSNTIITTMTNIFNNTGNGLEFLFFGVDVASSKTIIRALNINDLNINGTTIPFNSIDPNYSPNFRFNVIFNENENKPLYKTVGWMFGFKKSKYEINPTNININSSDSQAGTSLYKAYLESESSYGNVIANYLFVDIDDYQRNFTPDSIISYNSNKSYLGNNILARITVNSGFNTIVIDNAADRIFKEREYFGPVRLEKFNIRILDKFGDIVDFNYNDFSLVLELQILY